MGYYNEWQQVNDNIRRKVYVPGKSMMSMLVEFNKGAVGPRHSHPHEQLGYVVFGRLEFTIGNDKYWYSAGDCIIVPSNAEHEVLALEDSAVLETFTPLREDLMKKE